MPSLEQRVEALERQMADLQAMLESLLDCMRQQRGEPDSCPTVPGSPNG